MRQYALRKPKQRFSIKSQIKTIQESYSSPTKSSKQKSVGGEVLKISLNDVVKMARDYVISLTKEGSNFNKDVTSAGMGDPLAQEKVKNVISNFLSTERIYVLEDTLIEGMDTIESVFARTIGFDLIEDLIKLPDIEEVQINGRDIFIVKDGVAIPHSRKFNTITEHEDLQDRLSNYGIVSIGETKTFAQSYLYTGSRLVMTRSRYSAEPTTAVRNFVVKDVTLDILYERFGTINKKMAELLREFVLGEASIAIAGGTMVGKTTTLFALCNEVPEHLRIISLEKEFEIRLSKRLKGVRNIVELREDTNSNMSMEEAFKPILVLSPNWIVVGESKGSEISQAIQAGLRGHNVMLTMHSKYSDMYISDVIDMIKQDGRTHDEEALKSRIARAFNIVLIQKFVPNGKGGRRRVVSEITELVVDEEKKTFVPNKLVVWDTIAQDWKFTGNKMSRFLTEHMLNNHQDLTKLTELGLVNDAILAEMGVVK